jgi:hypothetical protein
LKPGGAFFLYATPELAVQFAPIMGERLEFRHWIALTMKGTYPRGKKLYPAHYALLYYTRGTPRVFNKVRLPIETCRHCGKEIRDYGGHRNKMNPEGVNLTDFWTDTSPNRHKKYKVRSGVNELKLIIPERAILMSTEPDDVVFDPFGGGGSTYQAAEKYHRRWIGKLVSEISHKIAGTEAPPDADDADRDHAAESRETDAILSEDASEQRPKKARKERINQPKTVSREVLASRKLSAPEFGVLMAAYAWSLGFFQAKRKGFVGDGQAANWTIWEKQFKPYGFVPILDFIHALTYIYNAAMAGRTTKDGWATYLEWITAVWQGRVAEVIAALQARQDALGPPLPDGAESDPRHVVAKSLTYLQNQQERMNYPAYRRQGLPITSCHIESTIKQLNYRVKGSEMFWTDDGAEALLQLSADLLCDSAPLDGLWSRRAAKMTGFRVYCRSKT